MTWRVLLATVCFAALLGLTPGQSAADQRLAQFDALIAEQDDPGMEVAVQGQVTGDYSIAVPDGVVVTRLLPTQEQRVAAEVGDVFQLPVVAAAEVQADGSYTIALDPDSELFGPHNDLSIDYTDGAGWEGQGMISVALEEDDAGALHFAPATVGIAATETGGVPSLDLSEPGIGGTADEEGAAAGYNNYHPCRWALLEDDIETWATMIVAGTNTTFASVEPTFARNTSSQLGTAIKFGREGWGEASGGVTVTNNSAITKVWPASNAYGTYSFRMEVEYQRWERSGIGCNYQELVPAGYTGGNIPGVKWGRAAKLTHCTRQARGSITIDSTRATNWNGGVKLADAGFSINVDAQSGYSDKTSVKFQFERDDRYLCGRFDNPGGTPGYLMADYKDR